MTEMPEAKDLARVDGDMPPGNWHAIEGPNGLCACGPVEGCPERLRRFIRGAVDFWHGKANFLERERERALAELPDAFARAPGSLAAKIQAYREFVTPYVERATKPHDTLSD